MLIVNLFIVSLVGAGLYVVFQGRTILVGHSPSWLNRLRPRYCWQLRPFLNHLYLLVFLVYGRSSLRAPYDIEIDPFVPTCIRESIVRSRPLEIQVLYNNTCKVVVEKYPYVCVCVV